MTAFARRTMNAGIACYALLLLGSATLANADPIYTMEHIGRKDGLPQSSVRAIAIDKLGFVWVGTETGVARYDGYRFKEITAPFGSGVVMTIHVDTRNRLWIRWFGKPLTLYDPSNEQWQVMDGPNGIDTYDGFLADTNGTVWLVRLSELVYFDEATKRIVAAVPLPPSADSIFPDLALFRDAVWVTTEHEVLAVDINTRKLVRRVPVTAPTLPSLYPARTRLHVHQDALWLCNRSGVFELQEDSGQWQANYRNTKQLVSACTFSKDGALWIGTQDAGAIRIHNGVEQRFQPRPSDQASLADHVVVSLQVDSRGEVWVITPGAAHRWLLAGDAASKAADRWQRFIYSPDSQRANPGAVAAHRITEDHSGLLWLGSEDAGLVKISPFARKAQLLVPPSSISTHVRTPVVDKAGNVWIGMNNDGVFRFHRATNTWTHFPANASNPSQLPSAEVRAMLAARDGSVWAGSNNLGTIGKFEPSTATWKRIAPRSETSFVFNMLEYPNGQILIGGLLGVAEFNPATLASRYYPTPEQTSVRAAVASRSGNVFVGTHLSGVLEFIPGTGFNRHWKNELSDVNVFSLYEDRHGMLWIGTWGGGLNRLDPASGNVQVIKVGDGLPDDTVFGIQPGRHDDLWVSTNDGLARIENCIVQTWPCRPTISVLDTTNGLPFSEFDAEAAGRAPNGELLFGGQEGLLILDPDKIELNPHAPRLQFSSISHNDKTLSPFWLEKTSPLLELRAQYGSLQVEFSALDFHSSNDNRYRYRLSRSSEWLSLGNNPSIALNNLGFGTHALEIMGTNNDGVWSKAPLTLSIRVLPPWYLSSLAWLTYVVLLLISIAAFVQWRERRLRANTLRLETTVADRTHELAIANKARDEFYANVSHEIRTPLTLLIGTAQELKNNPVSSNKDLLADDLVRHSDSLRRYVESLITVSHLQSSPTVPWLQEDVRGFLRNTIADFQRIAGDTKITLGVTGENFFVRSYPNALDTIFSNLLLNAIRYTPSGGTIAVTVAAHDEHVAIDIVDSGAGIDPELLGSLFERGQRGNGFARTTVGYGIGLNLVKQTVLALEGTIGAHNEKSGGACFTVMLPRAEPSLPIAAYQRAPLAIDMSMNASGAIRTESTGNKNHGRLLIIEDHDELRAYIVSIFAAHYRIRDAATVADGIALAKRHLPDVIICDVMLPDGEGFEVVAAIKSNTVTDHINVILLTALADEASRMKGLAHEADLYVTKPFNREQLELQVSNLVKQRRRIRRTAAREAWTEKSKAAPPIPKNESFESRLLAAMEAMYSDVECSIDTLASTLAMSRKQLERKTRYCFQCSPNVLLTRYRLDRAVELLKANLRIGDVAERCGFASQAHFGALFKKRFGHAPSGLKT